MGVTKAVSDRFGKGGIADRMIWFSGFPFLDNKEDHSFGVPVSHVMLSDVTTLPSTGIRLTEVERILSSSFYQGFPIVESTHSKTLIGYIGRTELRYAIDRAKRGSYVPSHATCSFAHDISATQAMTPVSPYPAVSFDAISATSALTVIDLSKFVDFTPLSVHPRLPLETVMELFKKLGPRVILVEYHGKLTGLVTVKDCLKYQFKAEAQENPRDDTALVDYQEYVWGIIKLAAYWTKVKVEHWTRGTIRFGDEWNSSNGGDGRPHHSANSSNVQDSRFSTLNGRSGNDDDDNGQELELEQR